MADTQDHLPTYQWWADAWREIADQSAADNNPDYADHCHWLADQNQNAANHDQAR